MGCGSGILSFFAAQAGARRVYGIEASRAAVDAELLVKVCIVLYVYICSIVYNTIGTY